MPQTILTGNNDGSSAPLAGSHISEAMDALKLTPQEVNLYQHHLSNLGGSGKIVQPSGDISTVLQAVVEHRGKFYNIPTVWNGKQLPPQAAGKQAAQVGWNNWPSYSSVKAAEKRYDDMHSFMERDTADYRSRLSPATSGAAQLLWGQR